jgi:hypothetical protein
MILASLDPGERAQFADLLDYLAEKASPSNPSGYIAEGSVQGLLNKQSPRIQQAFKAIDQFAETPRFAPYTQKQSEAERFDELGLDPASACTIKQALDANYVLSSLQDRMGTSTPDEPITLRDQLSAAADYHQGAENG